MLSSDISSNSGATLTRTTPEDIASEFWQQWTEQKDQLYRCCLKLMNFNSTDAEDALSQAMLKAWEKVQKYAGKIDNLKAWLVQLTRNLCIDIIRQRSRGAVGVESLEWAPQENVDTVSAVETPEKALEKDEKARVIQEAIASLPERLRETFILHFYQQHTHAEIAEEQRITYDNVCKRISLARKELKEKLSGYFRETKEEVKATVSSKVSPCSGEKEIKEVKKEKLESVECCVEPREEAAPVVQETITVSEQKECNEEVAVSWLSNIAGLSEGLRNTFILHFYQQRSHKEIAILQPKPCYDQGKLKSKMRLREKNSSQRSEMRSINVRYLYSLRYRKRSVSIMNNVQTNMRKVLSLVLVAIAILFTFNSPAYADNIDMECNAASVPYKLDASNEDGLIWKNKCNKNTSVHVDLENSDLWNLGKNYPYSKLVPATGNPEIDDDPDLFTAPDCLPAELVSITDGEQGEAYCYSQSNTITLAPYQKIRLVDNDGKYDDNTGYQQITLTNTTSNRINDTDE